MHIGLLSFVTDESMPVIGLATEAEDRGFESLLVPEKTHLPVSQRTPWPGGVLPEDYKRTYDPFVALAAAAAVTKRIRLGTGICMAVARDPIITAKEVASLDALSNGRFVFGVGYGWNAEEIEDHGVPFANRAAVLREKVLAMKAIWAGDEAGFQGEHVSFEPTWSWPKPRQQPHPPIVMGSRASAANFRDIAEYCDGWMPIEYFGKTIGKLPALRAAFEQAGRDPDAADVSVMLPVIDEGALDQYADAGVRRLVLSVPSGGADEVLPALDAYVPLIERYQG
ncbi:MAG: LLM class F420-dependent oxidoreductase [Acidimicrobiales bacterium]